MVLDNIRSTSRVSGINMENPATWNQVQKAIAEAIEEQAKDIQDEVCGTSEVTKIYIKLCERGFLKPEFCKPI